MSRYYKPLLIAAICVAALSSCATHPSDSDSGEPLTCEQHATVALDLNRWAAGNFDDTYGKTKDARGANVQLILIKQKVSSPYAASFNRSQDKASQNIASAREKGCDVSSYPLPPIDEFEKRLASIWPRGRARWWEKK